jgi:hypothetical protein
MEVEIDSFIDSQPSIRDYLHLVFSPDIELRLAHALRSDASLTLLEMLSSDPDNSVALAATQHYNHTSQSLDRLALHSSELVRLSVSSHTKTNSTTLFSLLDDVSEAVRREAVTRLIYDENTETRLQLIASVKLSREDLEILLTDADVRVRTAALSKLELINVTALESFLGTYDLVPSPVVAEELALKDIDTILEKQLDVEATSFQEPNTPTLFEAFLPVAADETNETQGPNFDLFDLVPLPEGTKPKTKSVSVANFLLRDKTVDSDRTTTLASEIAAELGWTNGFQDVLTLLQRRSERSVLYAVDHLKKLGVDLDELLLASDLKLLWEENEEYGSGIRYGKRGANYGLFYPNLPWTWALTIVRGFPNHPTIEELHEFVDQQFDWWRGASNRLKWMSFGLFLYELAKTNPGTIEFNNPVYRSEL